MPLSPLPLPLHDRIARQFGKNGHDAILQGFRADRVTSFRTNTLKTTDKVIMEFLRDNNIVYERIKSMPHTFVSHRLSSKELLKLSICKEGLIYAQGLSSMLPPLILNPKPGENVLDLCAAPGSKTSQMAARMQDKGRLVAMEKDEVRFQKLQHTLNLQGASFVEARQGDSVRLCKDYTSTFDAILADVPCSAEGRIDLKKGRTFRFWSERNITAHAKLQRSLLRAAVRSLKPKGRLVYSTCTLAPEENEKMISWLLEEFPNLKPAPFSSPLPGRKVNGGFYLLPSVKHEGLFVSLLQSS